MRKWGLLLVFSSSLLAGHHEIAIGPEVYKWNHSEGEGTAYGGYAHYENMPPFGLYSGLIGEIAESNNKLYYDAELRYGFVLDIKERVFFIPYFGVGFRGREFEDLVYYGLGMKGDFRFKWSSIGFDVRGIKIASDMSAFRKVIDGKWGIEVEGRVRQFVTSFFSLSAASFYREYAYDGEIFRLFSKNEKRSISSREYGTRFLIAFHF